MQFYIAIYMAFSAMNLVRDAFKKKIAEKETLVHMGGGG